MTAGGPDARDGPRRFIRNWLTFNDRRPMPPRRLWAFAATVAVLLLGSALLAWFGK